jgi:Domain of unknown function (DUF4185)
MIKINTNPLCNGNPAPPKLSSTFKVIQLTGDIDRETGKETLNQTGKRFGIYGTDLGVSFIHNGRLYFLFGDTNRRDPDTGLPASAFPGEDFNEELTDLDAIAYTTSDRAYNRITLTFNSDYPHIDDIVQLTGEHPIEGISLNQYMFVFFTTDLQPDGLVPTRTVLAKSSDDGISFEKLLYTLSTGKFIHISCEIIDNESINGLPTISGKGLLIWGSSVHRKSDIFLAHMPLNDITNKSSIRYFAGFALSDSKKPLWKNNEEEAKPLFKAECVGELSVRWNYYLNKWIMLYNCNHCNTNGIIIRLADKPWGDWSSPKIIFDPKDGYGKFIHNPGNDDIYDKGRNRHSDWGAVYGPYQITPYSTGIKYRYTKIYFTLSTWNPYQVIQMSAIITSDEEEKNPTLYANSINDRNDRKYAHISVVLAQLAKINNILFESSIHNSIYIADHIEWSQFHTHLTLRKKLKIKFLQLISNILSDDNKADIYATIIVELVKLTYDNDRFANIPNYMIHKKWAIETIHNGDSSILIEQLNQIVEEKDFLPDQDYLCYAYGSDDSNDHKYARISLLECKIGNDIKILWDIPMQGSLDNNFHIAWAKFHSVVEMREEIINKFQQIINKHQCKENIAKSFVCIIETILELSYPNDDNYFDHSSIYEWALSNLKDNKKESLLIMLSRYVNDKKFLIPIPSIDISV